MAGGSSSDRRKMRRFLEKLGMPGRQATVSAASSSANEERRRKKEERDLAIRRIAERSQKWKYVVVAESASFIATIAGAAGGLVSDPDFFWLTIAGVYALLFSSAAHLVLREDTGWPLKIGGWIFLAGIAAWFSVKVVFYPAPLDVRALLSDTNYSPGVSVGSIRWRPEFAEVRVTLRNESDKDYEDLDITLSLEGAWIGGIAQTDKLQEVQILSPKMPVGYSSSVTFSDGRKISFPWGEGGASISSEYRVIAETLPKDGVTIHVAVAAASKGTGAAMFGPRPAPTHLVVAGEYRVGMRPYKISRRVPMDTKP